MPATGLKPSEDDVRRIMAHRHIDTSALCLGNASRSKLPLEDIEWFRESLLVYARGNSYKNFPLPTFNVYRH